MNYFACLEQTHTKGKYSKYIAY